MTYVTTMERRGIKKGIEKGIVKGVRQGVQQEASKTLRKIISKRFGSVTADSDARIRAASVEELEAWIDIALDAQSIQQVFQS